MTAGDARPDALLAALQAAYDDGVARYGSLALDFERFAERATDRLRSRMAGRNGDPNSLAHALVDECRNAVGADLYLAIACDQEIAGAWDVLLARFVPGLASVARRRGIEGSAAEELARDVVSDLMAHPGPGAIRTRLAKFDGAGSLMSWLGVVLLRRVANLRRRDERLVPLSDGADLDSRDPGIRPPAGFDAEGDPATQAVDSETLQRIARALREAWFELGPLERQGLSLRYRDGVQQKVIARLLDVGESRLCRLLQRAVATIRDTVIREFPRGAHRELALRDSEWNAIRDAIAVLLQSPPSSSDPTSEGPTRDRPT